MIEDSVVETCDKLETFLRNHKNINPEVKDHIADFIKHYSGDGKVEKSLQQLFD